MDHPADPPPVAAATTTDPPSTDPPTEPSSSTTEQPGTSTVPDLRPFSMFTAGSANQNTTATLVDNEDEDDDDDAHSIVTVSTADSTDDHRVRQSQFALPPLGAASKEKPMEWDPFESSAPPPPPPSEPVPMMATMAMPEPQVPTGPRAPDVQVVQMPTPVVQPPGGYMPTAVQVQPPGVSVLPPSYPGPTATAPPPYTGAFGQSTYNPSAFGTPAQPAAEKSMSATPATPKSKDLEKNSNSMRENTFCYLGACSAFSIYWCCMLLLFVIPLGGILIFFWWSSRIQVSLDGAASVASSASAPDANSLLFNMTVKVKITNKNSSPIQIREVVADTWFGGSGGFLQKKEIGRGRLTNNITVPGHGESTVSVPVQMRFEASTDPGFNALEQVARGCGRVSGGKRDIDMQVKVGVGATINDKQLRTGVADTAHVACPLADDFKSDLLTKVVGDLKKKDGTA